MNAAVKFAVDAPRHVQDSGCAVLLSSGKLFDIRDDYYADLSIEDVARGLSVESRYAGQFQPGTINFYSVAQHSVLCLDYFSTRELRLAALLHDAEEFILRDIPSPLKSILPQYVALAEEVRRKIFERFDVPYELYPEIKPVDDLMYRRERKNWWTTEKLAPADVITAYPPSTSYVSFMHNWNAYYE